MPYGEAAFSAEELAEDLKREEEQKREYEEKLQNAFLKDGGTRKITIEAIAKENKVSKVGNNYTLHTFTLKDVDTQEEEVIADRDFSITNALAPIKKQLGTDLRTGVTVLKITTAQKGTREWNGVNYPTYSHVIELVENPIDKLGTGKATANLDKDTEQDVSKIPF